MNLHGPFPPAVRVAAGFIGFALFLLIAAEVGWTTRLPLWGPNILKMSDRDFIRRSIRAGILFWLLLLVLGFMFAFIGPRPDQWPWIAVCGIGGVPFGLAAALQTYLHYKGCRQGGSAGRTGDTRRLST